MVGSRWALVVVFHWRVTYVPQGPHCHPARIFSHEYHTYQKYKYLNTGKTSTPKKFQRQEAHLVMALTRTSGPQLDKAGPGF